MFSQSFFASSFEGNKHKLRQCLAISLGVILVTSLKKASYVSIVSFILLYGVLLILSFTVIVNSVITFLYNLERIPRSITREC